MVENQAEPAAAERLDLGGDYDVAVPDLGDHYTIGGDDETAEGVSA